ncbi:hypothetical protein C3747_90g164 [Trypanosoma cruzi]|uniref:Tyrosine decarboxylase n=1 Tax=Trypanosoma cruzi TaxID=5693 RepID=A0A2V2WL59_TRYCR|nr:hypothetical protein C3747_90g164 [Trypanosoma cruzi]
MWGSRPRYRRNVKALLDRSARFLSSLLHGVPNASFSLRLNAPSLWGKSECTPEEWQRCLGELLCRGAAANCLLDTKSHVAEVHASLVAAFLPKPHWNNSITHSMDIISLSSLEKEVSDTVAALLHLPARFLWVRRAEAVMKKAESRRTHSSTKLHSASPAALISAVERPVPYVDAGDAGGGGLLHSTSLESLIVLLTTARAQAHARYLSAHFSSPEEEARLSQRLVLYCSDQCQPMLKKAARCIGIRHIRVLKTVYSPHVHNYPMQPDILKALLAEDVANGLYPLLVCGVFGARTTGAVDPLEDLAEICHRVKVWFHIDASHSGLALAGSAATAAYGFRDEAGQPGEFTSVDEKDTAAERMWEQCTSTFHRAALLADSIHFGVSTSFLPTLSANISASLLYVADVAKVKVTMQGMNAEDEAGGNTWCTPGMTDVASLRLDAPDMRSNEIFRLALILMPCSHASVGSAVRAHQAALRYLEQRLRADGRFDCSLHASCFGMVLFRWLTLADEETAGLMQRWSDVIASSSAMNEAGGHRYPHRVSLGLTQVQRRVYICVALAADGDDGDACVSRCDVDALVDLLKKAADEWSDMSSSVTSAISSKSKT